MNYFKLAMQVFNKHKLEFIKVSVNRQKLKQKLILNRNYGQPINNEETSKLRAEIKEGTERINNLIKEILK